MSWYVVRVCASTNVVECLDGEKKRKNEVRSSLYLCKGGWYFRALSLPGALFHAVGP